MQWALKNQGTRRNLTDEEIKKCEREALMRLGRRYNAEKTDKKKTLKRGNSPKPHVEGTGRATAAKVAKEEGVSRATVERAGARMEIHDAVEKVASDLKPRANERSYNHIHGNASVNNSALAALEYYANHTLLAVWASACPRAATAFRLF